MLLNKFWKCLKLWEKFRKKLIKEVKTNFKLVGIWFALGGALGSLHTTQIFHFNGKTCDLSSELLTKRRRWKPRFIFSFSKCDEKLRYSPSEGNSSFESFSIWRTWKPHFTLLYFRNVGNRDTLKARGIAFPFAGDCSLFQFLQFLYFM